MPYTNHSAKFRILFGYFLKGLFLITPAYFTITLIISAIKKIDAFIGGGIPGLGILLLLVGATSFGYFASNFLLNSAMQSFESTLKRVPVVNIIYNSSKDLINALANKGKHFDKPVLVTISEVDGIYRLGFITQDSLDTIGLDNMASVYLLKPYSFFGELVIVKKEYIKPLTASASEITKFVVSGGFVKVK